MESLWEKTVNIEKRQALDRNISTDVAIVGGGMAGLLTGFMLKERGINAVIFEADRISSGQTKNTTAKITAQHGLIYNKLVKSFGFDKAQKYFIANNSAIDSYEKIIKEKNIDCDFKRLPACIYSCKDYYRLADEYKILQSLGADVEFADALELPFKIKSAVVLQNQAQFNPLKFIREISRELNIYENTKVRTVENKRIITDKGFVVKARRIVIATHYPIINFKGFYFLRMYQQRSLVTALKNAPELNGMYLGIDKNGYSLRSSGNYLLFGGQSYRTGENKEKGSYDMLLKKARLYFPKSDVLCSWYAQDCKTLDSIPYIGKYSEKTPNVYVATGFNKWGMTSSMVSAKILSDMISSAKNQYAKVFSPQRFNIKASAKTTVNIGYHACKSLGKQYFHIPQKTVDDIPKGTAKIVEFCGKKAGVYKNENGDIFAVTVKCPHVHCQLEWNPDELTWECPCHGSTFDYKGNLISSPAVDNIKLTPVIHPGFADGAEMNS